MARSASQRRHTDSRLWECRSPDSVSCRYAAPSPCFARLLTSVTAALAGHLASFTDSYAEDAATRRCCRAPCFPSPRWPVYSRPRLRETWRKRMRHRLLVLSLLAAALPSAPALAQRVTGEIVG